MPVYNDTSTLMAYFGVDAQEFQKFWFSLHIEEQMYYRSADLSS